MEEYWDTETDWALKIALTVSNFEDKSGNLIVITNLRPFWFIFFKRESANVALRRLLILFPLPITNAVHQLIRLELVHNRRLPLDEHV